MDLCWCSTVKMLKSNLFFAVLSAVEIVHPNLAVVVVATTESQMLTAVAVVEFEGLNSTAVALVSLN